MHVVRCMGRAGRELLKLEVYYGDVRHGLAGQAFKRDGWWPYPDVIVSVNRGTPI